MAIGPESLPIFLCRGRAAPYNPGLDPSPSEVSRMGPSPTPPADAGQAQRVLDALDSGIALLDAHLRVTWANPAFRQWCPAEPVGRELLDALARPEVVSHDPAPWP